MDHQFEFDSSAAMIHLCRKGLQGGLRGPVNAQPSAPGVWWTGGDWGSDGVLFLLCSRLLDESMTRMTENNGLALLIPRLHHQPNRPT